MTPEKWEKAKEVFNSVLESDGGDREAILTEGCASDQELRAEVESLLAAFAKEQGFIENPAVEEALTLIGSFKSEVVAGRRIDRYTLVREIGRGGMGSVYLATRADDEFKKRVAIKLIKRGMDTEDILRRFRNERQILASLDHPNIGRLLDGGSGTDGLPFFVMEYIEGLPLTEYCDRHRLSTGERLGLFREICAAVQHAHQNLVVHRDLKPNNIVITSEGVPKLLDFGIAKFLNPELSPQTIAPTATMMRMMTRDYASPEQVRGEPITTASDVYSLGVLLYRLLTGHHPYKFKTPLQQDVERVICESAPERPSAVIARTEKVDTGAGATVTITPDSVSRARDAQPEKLRRVLSGDLDNIILMAMRKEPKRRYASVEQLSEDIRRHLEGLPVIARKDTFTYRTSKFIGRNKIGVAAAVLVSLAILVGLLVTIWQARAAQRERNKAEAINSFLQMMLGASSPESSLRENKGSLTVKDVLDEASKQLAAEQLSSQPEVKAELQRIVGATYLTLGHYDLAELNLSSALEAQTRIHGEDNPETLKTLVLMGQLWLSKGDYARADNLYRQKLSILRAEQQKGSFSVDSFAMALQNSALLRRAQGDSKEAETLLREELAVLAESPPVSNNNRGVAEAVLALTLADQGDFDEAIRMVRARLVKISQQSKGDTPELSATLTGLGSFLMEKGEFVEAEEHFRQAETIYRKLFSQSYLALGDNLRLQAQALFLNTRYAEAEGKIHEALEIYKAGTSTQYVNYPTALIMQGLIYARTDRTGEAEKLLREAVQIRAQYTPETHFLRAVANGALGDFLTTQNRFNEAEPLLLSSYESLEKSQAANSPRTRMALQRLVALYENWRRLETANQYRARL